MTPQKIKTSIVDGVALITLSDPATLNAAGLDMMAELDAALTAFEGPEAGVRCVVLTGEGRAFCSGANLSGRGGGGDRPAVEPDPQGPDAGLALERVYNPLITRMRNSPLPLVAAVNGVAAGIGCSIALTCDLVAAAQSAYFLQAFRRIGLVPDGGATYLLSRLVGKARAMELALLGEPLPAQTALEWGLINRCVADAELIPTALEIAKALASGPKSLAYTRKLIWEGLDAEWGEQLQAERLAQRTAGRTADSQEGVRAFLEKRPARFKGE